MRLISRLRDECFCAFCKSPRRIYSKKHVGFGNVLGLLLVTGGITHSFWGGPDPRGVVLFMVMIVTGEIFIYLRWRANVVCRMCGFDPVLYKKSPERASQAVNQFFREQSENPAFWLSKSPLLDLHRRLKEGEKRQHDISALRAHIAAKPRTSLSSAARKAAAVKTGAPSRPSIKGANP